MLVKMLQAKEIESYIYGLEPRDHMILFYDTLEGKRNILHGFLADGLGKKKGLVYICSDESPDQVRSGLESYGVDVGANEEAGRLLIRNYDEWYIENGRAEALKIITHWNEAYNRFSGKGLGMRVTGETSCFFRKNMVRELLRYEYALHKILTIPMEAICAYDLQTIVDTGYKDMIMPLVRAHGKAIFASQVGSMILEPENVEDTDIEKLLEIKI